MAKGARRAAIYVRVSTDQQTVDNQIHELRQIAEQRGWTVVHVYSDAGISGAGARTSVLGSIQCSWMPAAASSMW